MSVASNVLKIVTDIIVHDVVCLLHILRRTSPDTNCIKSFTLIVESHCRSGNLLFSFRKLCCYNTACFNSIFIESNSQISLSFDKSSDFFGLITPFQVTIVRAFDSTLSSLRFRLIDRMTQFSSINYCFFVISTILRLYWTVWVTI